MHNRDRQRPRVQGPRHGHGRLRVSFPFHDFYSGFFLSVSCRELNARRPPPPDFLSPRRRGNSASVSVDAVGLCLRWWSDAIERVWKFARRRLHPLFVGCPRPSAERKKILFSAFFLSSLPSVFCGGGPPPLVFVVRKKLRRKWKVWNLSDLGTFLGVVFTAQSCAIEVSTPWGFFRRSIDAFRRARHASSSTRRARAAVLSPHCRIFF